MYDYFEYTEPNVAKGKWIIPEDIRRVYKLVGSMFQEFPNSVKAQITEWNSDLRVCVSLWGIVGEPNWQDYRDWLNEIFTEGSISPLLFEEVENA